MSMVRVVHKIACDKLNSPLVPFEPSTPLQGIRIKKLYELLALLRIFFAINLQTGWIHQDEFSNSLEVFTGDYFNLQTFKTPGFNSSLPTQSVAFMQTAVYVPYILFHRYLTYMHPVGLELVPKPEVLLLLPRIFFTLLSFLLDFILIKLCLLHEESSESNLEDNRDDLENFSESSSKATQNTKIYRSRLLTLASSGGVLVLSSRTHSCILSSIFFGALLYYISRSILETEKYVKAITAFHTCSNKYPLQKVALLKKVKSVKYSPISDLHFIALITVAASFNSPQFLLSYAIVPLIFYLQRGVSSPHVGLIHFHLRIFVFFIYGTLFSIPFIIWDSFYYGNLTISDIRSLNLSLNSFVICPINYFTSSNGNSLSILAKFITVTVFFNLLGILGFISFGREALDICFKNWGQKPKWGSAWFFLNASIFIPLFFLIQVESIFDLLPLLLPLVFMHGHKVGLLSRYSWKVGILWVVFNGIIVGWWGQVHQGGILSSFIEISEQTRANRFNDTQVDLLVAQIAPIPPTFLFVIPQKWKTILTDINDFEEELLVEKIEKIEIPEYFFQEEQLIKTVLKLEEKSKLRVFHIGESSQHICYFESEIYRLLSSDINLMLLPTSYDTQLKNCFNSSAPKLIKTYWGHVVLQWKTLSNEEKSGTWEDFSSIFPKLSIGLNLYRFEKGNGNKFESDFNFENGGEFWNVFTQSILMILTAFVLLMTFVTYIN